MLANFFGNLSTQTFEIKYFYAYKNIDMYKLAPKWQ